MCQLFTDFSKKNIPEEFIAFKVVMKLVENGEPVMRSVVYSFYEWILGLNVSNRKSTRTKSDERLTGSVDEGFHFYTELESAQKLIDSWHKIPNDDGMDKNTYVILKCTIRREDVVGRGLFAYGPSVVATKCWAELQE